MEREILLLGNPQLYEVSKKVRREELEELAEQLDIASVSGPTGKMSAADYNMLKTKHRSDEMKEIAKADKEYLKVIFGKIHEDKNSGTGATAMSGSTPAPAFDTGSSFEGAAVDAFV